MQENDDLFQGFEIGGKVVGGGVIAVNAKNETVDNTDLFEGFSIGGSVVEKPVDPELIKQLDALNAEMGTTEKFLVGAGRGMTTLGRAVGLADPEPDIAKLAFNRLSDDSMAATIGEIVGEAAPFMAAAPLSGVGLSTGAGRALIPQATRMATRVGGAAALGALEGGLITKGRGGDAGETTTGAVAGGFLAGSLEAVLPVLGRMGRKVFQRLGRKPKGPLLTPEGTPTPELQQALEETGTSFADLTDEAFAAVNKKGVDPAQAARSARFKAQGITATAGDITQDFGQQATEQRLISQAGAQAGEPLRQAKLQQSEIFKSKVNDLVDSLGVPDDAGDAMKAALKGRKKLLQAEKNALYKEVADASPELASTPLFTDTIADAIPSSKEIRRLSRLAPGPVEATKDLLVEFGIDNSDEAIEAFADEITPLSLGNFEDFRQAINLIERSDTTGAVKVFTGPIKIALDAEAEMIGKVVRNIPAKAFVNTVDELPAGLSDESFGLADEILDNGAKVTKDGRVKVYHRTTPEKAKAIKKSGVMRGDEDGVFFSTSPTGQAEGFGDAVVELDIPLDRFQLDDVFGSEAHLRIPTRRAGQSVDVSGFTSTPSAPAPEILDTIKQARQRVRQIKTEFSPQSITGRMIDVKRDGVTPVIEASKAARELLKPGAPIENLKRTLQSLSKSGDKGKKAIGDLRASVVLNALEDALKAPSRKTAGIETIGGNQFAKSLSKMGDDKLRLLFSGNEKSLSRLMNLKQTALDITPSAAATPKGSAPVILDILNRAGRLPGLAAVRDTVNFIAKAGADDRAVAKALKAKPIFRQTVTALERDMPALASALGVAGLVTDNQEQNNGR